MITRNLRLLATIPPFTMSTRYQLRARASRSGLATQIGMPAPSNFVTNVLGSQIPQESSHDAASTSPAMPLADAPEKPPRTYSEVAASRPSSPVLTSGEGMLRHPPPTAQVRRTTARERIPASAGVAFRNNIVPDCKSDLSELIEPSDDDEKSNPWIQVVPRRVHSLDSFSRARINNKFIAPHEMFRTEKETVVTRADRPLPFAQKEHDSQARCYERRIENNLKPRERLDPSAPRGKEKGVDPRNLGAAQLSDGDLDVDAQHTVLESNNKIHRLKIPAQPYSDDEISDQEKGTYRKNEPNLVANRTAERAKGQKSARLEKGDLNVGMNRTADQIVPESNRALKSTHRRSHRERRNFDPGSSDSSSDSSSSDSSDSSDSETSSSSMDTRHASRRSRHKSRRKRRRPKSRRTKLKPIPPKEYDGVADARAYHRFVTEGTEYVKSGNVQRKKQAFVLSYYLKGKAYDFYTQKVSMNCREWSLKDFFEGLFNYCFPVNYRMLQRKKLDKCLQDEKSVSEYVYELEELFNMIGIINDLEKVIRLWDGLDTSIQKALWRDGYNPELSSWDEVRTGAETIEISEMVPDSDEKFSSESEFEAEGDESETDDDEPINLRFFGHRKVQNSVNSQSERKDTEESEDDFEFIKKERSTPRISDTERTELMASGRCFNCKSHGHLARDCLDQVSIKTEPSVDDAALLANSNIQYVHEDELEEDFLYTGNIELGYVDFSPACPFVDNGLNLPQMRETDRGGLTDNRRAYLPEVQDFSNIRSGVVYCGDPVAPMLWAECLSEVLKCFNKNFELPKLDRLTKDIETLSKPSKNFWKNNCIMDVPKDLFVLTGREEQKEGGNGEQTHMQITHTSNFVADCALGVLHTLKP